MKLQELIDYLESLKPKYGNIPVKWDSLAQKMMVQRIIFTYKCVECSTKHSSEYPLIDACALCLKCKIVQPHVVVGVMSSATLKGK